MARQRGGIFLALLLTSLVGCVSPAFADVVHKCVTLMSATGQTASTNGTIYNLQETDPKKLEAKAFTGIRTASNSAGSSPTLDVVIQTCETDQSSSCADSPISFTQCTTGTCTKERIDTNQMTVNFFPYVRAKTTIGGTSTPTYDVTVKLCYK